MNLFHDYEKGEAVNPWVRIPNARRRKNEPKGSSYSLMAES